MRASEIQSNKLVIFDIDDTLVHTQTKVHVIKDGHVVKSLNSHDFTHYKLQPGEEFDFGDFRDAREFFANAKPIIPMLDQLKHDIATGNKVVMVTARADFNDKELFLDTFRKYGVDMNKVHVYRAGNMTGKIQTEEKKKIIIRNLLDKGNYTKAIMYDDAVPNLHSFMELKAEYPNTKFYAWHVSLEGEASEYSRTNEDLDRRGFLKGLGGAAVAAAGLGAQDATGAELKKMNVVDNSKSRLLYDTAKPYIKGTELAQFMAQCAHETANFSTLVEFGGPEHFKKYDPQFNPKKAQELGNTQPGDGEKYKGRGFLQITGRDNYKRIGQSLKLPLEQKPEMVENPEVAAWTSVWYWIKQVRDKVKNFGNTKQATKPINPGLKGLKDREKKFANYQAAMAPPKDKHHPHDIKVASR